ncbi:MAG: flagellar hook-basal body complex protein [Rhodospirillaceae bacterium]|jgi:flagellar hook protein FlgE|nr:flagellar hook-basal body complex protein [Rhodospirillaceae bacterium]MBT5565603.1 flagellar hook-basal body complex protein [Rhodospirillaceae bacterium]MBT6088372.1 flagellar hook-basal body complex protein [Rhodospirillaceae bacterium]
MVGLMLGVSGLQAQSSAMGAIADNVTNINTIGYKATQVNFKTLVTSQVSLTQYSPGGVQAAPRQSVDLQGLLQATTASTDLALSGQGFFVANEAAQPQSGDQFAFTRAGSFRVDKEGFLQNVGGYYMQGWPLSFFDGSNGAAQVQVGNNTFMKSYIDGSGDRVLINDNVIDNRNLRPINLQTIGGTASPTTTVAIGANLPAEALVGGSERVNNLIFDSLGNPHNLTYEFRKTAANNWDFAIEQPAQSAVVELSGPNGDTYFSAGRLDFLDSFTAPLSGTLDMVAGNGDIATIILDSALADVTAYTPTGVPAQVVNTTGRTLSQILDQVATRMNTFLTDATVFGAAPTPPGDWARRIAGENGITFDQAAETGGGNVDMSFTANINDGGGNSVIFQNDPAGYAVPMLSPTAGWYDLSAGTLGINAIEFSGSGTPNLLFGLDAATANMPDHTLEIVWANGAENMAAGNQNSPAIEVFTGNFGTPDGLTQLSGNFQLNFLQQNGAKFGNFAGVSVGQDGIVTALFDNGVTRPVFMIPVATFTNPNGLNNLSGNVWLSTDNSGNPVMREAGDAGAGQINAAALESSTVDLGQEFTRMITTQRAYSSAAKVITTSDDMLEELLRIKR